MVHETKLWVELWIHGSEPVVEASQHDRGLLSALYIQSFPTTMAAHLTVFLDQICMYLIVLLETAAQRLALKLI